jgi:hypothetical protein
MEEEEIWKPIKGYEGLYEVSSIGRVRCLNYRNRGEIHIKASSGLRYCQVCLTKDGKMHCFYVHRLVAEAYLPEPKEGETQVNHKNGDKRDNRISNLEWVSPIVNVNNPVTKPNLRKRYHREGEFERRSAAMKKKYIEHPEIKDKIREAKRRNKEKGLVDC